MIIIIIQNKKLNNKNKNTFQTKIYIDQFSHNSK